MKTGMWVRIKGVLRRWPEYDEGRYLGVDWEGYHVVSWYGAGRRYIEDPEALEPVPQGQCVGDYFRSEARCPALYGVCTPPP